MKALLIGIAVAAVLIGALACSQPKQSAVAQSQGSAATPPVPTAAEAFQLRSQCAKLGEKILADHPSYDRKFTEGQLSHYNPLTNRCYVELNLHNTDTTGPVYVHRQLWDGQTGEILADFKETGRHCPSNVESECTMDGYIFGSGEAMMQADAALAHDVKSHYPNLWAVTFIEDVMTDDRRR